ncbi:Hypothetical predicted protein [Podarcis lilfordi]|uniref:Uncharacterized protein n=1 Tax=Podarcis lilfordi TaxID=74358 RepID=A0AA35L8G3_9SAUR|nr:Hypothetical predicted protein [Podarcis lilfordi]
MAGCFTCCHRRSRSENNTKLPKTKEEPQEGETLPAAPATPPAPDPEPQQQEVKALLTSPPAETLLDPTRGSLLLLQKHLQVLKEMQGQYLQAEVKIRSACHQFPRSLRAASLQICRTRRRLIRTEVRLQRQASSPGVCQSSPGPSLSSSKPTLESTSASSSGEVVSITPTTSSFSLPPHPLSPPPPSPPLLQPDLRVLQKALETLLEIEAHQLQERKRDVRTCQECLRSLRELRAQLQKVRSRLWRVEAILGIQVPPRELEVGEQEEEEEEEEEE